MSYINESLIWRFNTSSDVVAPNYVDLAIGSARLIAMDFQVLMPTNDSIASITSMTVADVTGATEPTISATAISSDKQRVEITLATASATAGTYTFTGTITTVNGDTIVGKGRLVLA